MRKINKIHFIYSSFFYTCIASILFLKIQTLHAEVITFTKNNQEYELDLGGFAIGIATSQELTMTPTALTAWIPLSQKIGIQAYAGTNANKPFHFGTGAVVKGTVLGNNSSGLHVGGGATVGTTQSLNPSKNKDLFVKIIGLGGIHFAFEGLKNIQFHFDIGPGFTSIGEHFQFNFGATSPLLGASVFYYF